MNAKRKFTFIYVGLVILSLVALMLWSYVSLISARTAGQARLSQELTAIRMALITSYSVEEASFKQTGLERFLDNFPHVLLVAIYDADRLEGLVEREHQAVMVHLERSRNTRYAFNPLTQTHVSTTLTMPNQHILEADLIYALITSNDILHTANYALFGLIVLIVLTIIVFIFVRMDEKQKKTAYVSSPEYTPKKEDNDGIEEDSPFFEKVSAIDNTPKAMVIPIASPLDRTNFATEMMNQPIANEPIHDSMTDESDEELSDPTENLDDQDLDEPMTDLSDEELSDPTENLDDQDLDEPMTDLSDEELSDPTENLDDQDLDEPMTDLSDEELSDPTDNLDEEELDDSMTDLSDEELSDPTENLDEQDLDDSMTDLSDEELSDPTENLDEQDLDDSMTDLSDETIEDVVPSNSQPLESIRQALQRADENNSELSVWFCMQQEGDSHFNEALTQELHSKNPDIIINKEKMGFEICLEKQDEVTIKKLISQTYVALNAKGYHLASGVSSRNERQVSAQLLRREAQAALEIVREKDQVVFFKPDPIRFKQLGL